MAVAFLATWLSSKAVAFSPSPPLISPAWPLCECVTIPQRRLSRTNLQIRQGNMDLIRWSLNATDTVFSTRNLGSGEPAFPDGTFAAGYAMDAWERWRVVCLAAFSVEDVEDVYLFGTVITGILLIGLGIALVYRKIDGVGTAVTGPQKLPDMIDAVGRAVGTQAVGIDRKVEIIWEKLTSVSTQTVATDGKVNIILERLMALQRSIGEFETHHGQNGSN